MAPRPPQNNSSGPQAQTHDDQFDASDYLKQEDYNADIDGVKKRIETIETKIGTRPAIVATLEDVLEHDRNIDPVMTKYIEDHIDLMPMINKSVDTLDKRLVKAFMKKTGIWVLGAVWSLVLIIATAWITAIVSK
jgi:hypothetical protein